MLFQDLSACIELFIGVLTDADHCDVLLGEALGHLTELGHLIDAVVTPGGPEVDHGDFMILEDILTSDRVAVEIRGFKADDGTDQFFAPIKRRIEFRALQGFVKSGLQILEFLLVCRCNAGQILLCLFPVFKVIAIEHHIAGGCEFCHLVRN